MFVFSIHTVCYLCNIHWCMPLIFNELKWIDGCMSSSLYGFVLGYMKHTKNLTSMRKFQVGSHLSMHNNTLKLYRTKEIVIAHHFQKNHPYQEVQCTINSSYVFNATTLYYTILAVFFNCLCLLSTWF